MKIFSLCGDILLNDNGTSSKLDEIEGKAKGVGTGFENAFGKIASAALKVGAILVAGIGFKDVVDEANASQEALAQQSAVLKSTGEKAGMTAEQLTQLAEANVNLSGSGKVANLESENLLLTFTNIGKSVFPQATTACLDMARGMHEDLNSATIQVGKALQDPIAGVTALQRVGVKLSDQQKEQVKSFMAVNNVAAAQSVIIKELGVEFGGSALAFAKTLPGQMTIFKENLIDIGSSIVNQVTPALLGFFTWINSKMPVIQSVTTTVMNGVLVAVKSVSDFIKNQVVPVIQNNVIPACEKFYNWIAPKMPSIEKTVKDTFNNIKTVMQIVSDYVNNVLLPAWEKFYNWIAPKMPIIEKYVNEAFTFIKTVMKVVSDFINNDLIPAIEFLVNCFMTYFPKIQSAVMQAYNYIKPKFDSLVSTIKTDLLPVVQSLWEIFKKAMPGILAICQMVFPVIVFLIGAVIDALNTFIKIVTGIYNVIKPALDTLATIFSATFGGILKIIQGVQAALNLFNGTPVQNKTATITTNQVINYSTTGNPLPGQPLLPPLPHNAAGTDNFAGGLTHINEEGGEIVGLPNGSQIIPHDISMEMAKNKNRKMSVTQNLNVTNMNLMNEKDKDTTLQQLQFLTELIQ